MAGVTKELAEDALMERYARAREEQGEEVCRIGCDRCGMVMYPMMPKPGRKRKVDDVRVRYKLALASPLGKRALFNVTVLCGMCTGSFDAQGGLMFPSQWKGWIETLASDQTTYDKKQLMQAEAKEAIQQDLQEAGMLEGVSRTGTRPMMAQVLPTALQDYDEVTRDAVELAGATPPVSAAEETSDEEDLAATGSYQPVPGASDRAERERTEAREQLRLDKEAGMTEQEQEKPLGIDDV